MTEVVEHGPVEGNTRGSRILSTDGGRESPNMGVGQVRNLGRCPVMTGSRNYGRNGIYQRL